MFVYLRNVILNIDMKAIDTVYNGYKFRSRLEARWAVFFGNMKLEYEYESEGYELDSGLRYLPDFYLPLLDVYVEIKPQAILLDRNDIIKITSFGLSENKNLLLIIGSPGKQQMYLINRHNSLPYDEIEGCYAEYTTNKGEEFIFSLEESNAEVVFATDMFSGGWTLAYPNLRGDYHEYTYKSALYAGRQSRFEFKDKFNFENNS